MTGKPADLPTLQIQPQKPLPTQQNVSQGPSYNDAFAQFLQNSKPKEDKKPSQPIYTAVNTPVKKEAKTPARRNTKKAIQNPPQVQQQESYQVNQQVPSQNTQQMYAIQETAVTTQDGQQQKMYYTILDSQQPAIANPTFDQHYKMANQQQQFYGQQQQSF